MAQQSTWEADKMLDAYIYDYLVKKNLQVTANSLLMEANLQADSVAIDAPEGFLLEWWSIFWDLYISRTNGNPSETASAYTNVPLQRRDPNNSPLDELAIMFKDPSSLYGPGIMQSNPGIANEGLNSEVGGHPLEGCISNALHQIQPILGAQIQEPLLQSTTQFQLLPQEPQQQPLAQLPELEGDLGISPSYIDMEAQICTWPINSLNAKDHQSTTNDGSLVSPMQSTPSNINTSQISQSSCPQQSNQNRKWTAISGAANSAGTGNIAGDSPNSSSPHTTGADDRVAVAADGVGALHDDDYGNDLFGPLTRNPSEPAAEHSKDGKVLAGAGFEKVLLWNMETQKTKINSKDHSRLISDVRFRPNWMQLLTSSNDTTVRLWDAAQPNSCLQTYTGPRSAAKSIDFHPTKNELFCSCYANNEIHFWNINQNSATHFFKGGSSQVRFQPRIGHLLASSSWKNLKIFDVETQRQVPLSSEDHYSLVKTVCWDNNGDCLASLSRDCIKIWSVTSGQRIHELSSSGKHFRSCVFHPTHSSLLVIGCFQSIRLWNIAQNKYMEVHAHKDLINCVAQSGVTGMIASTSLDFSMKIWK